MAEDLIVTLETAMLAREAKYDDPCPFVYITKISGMFCANVIQSPKQTQLAKWLRIERGLLIDVYKNCKTSYDEDDNVCDGCDEYDYNIYDNSGHIIYDYDGELGFDNYGDAFEDALKTSLKMITHDNQ